MEKRYPALHMVASFYKSISVIVILVGLGASFWWLIQGEQDLLSRVIAVGGILGSVILGVILYSQADFLCCIMDIEANTRSKEKTLPPQP